MCWAGCSGSRAANEFTASHPEWSVCNRPALAPLGLCDEHYEELAVRTSGRVFSASAH